MGDEAGHKNNIQRKNACGSDYNVAMPTPVAIFFGCWILLCIGGWIFDRRASYETKKSLHPFIVIGMGIIFAGFVEWVSGGKIPWPFLGIIALITFLNIRNIRFCPRCGATQHSGFNRPKFCLRCGADLSVDPNEPTRNQ
jgi:hypothetical protein